MRQKNEDMMCQSAYLTEGKERKKEKKLQILSNFAFLNTYTHIEG